MIEIFFLHQLKVYHSLEYCVHMNILFIVMFIVVTVLRFAFILQYILLNVLISFCWNYSVN